MDHFPTFLNDVDFTQTLVTEQSVFCLPAQVNLTMAKCHGGHGEKSVIISYQQSSLSFLEVRIVLECSSAF